MTEEIKETINNVDEIENELNEVNEDIINENKENNQEILNELEKRLKNVKSILN